MDLETENRIAAILMKEAAELRRQAQSEGALAYLRQPTARFRPNSRFLTATVRGVQQANRVVEVNEMWRLREKQLELDNRLRGSRNESSTRRSYEESCESHRSRSSSCNELEISRNASPISKKRCINDLDPVADAGLRDDEVDEFLHSRTKRGRGAVGSRMDETGPYLPSCPDSKTNVSESTEKKKARVLLGPEKPYYLKSSESSDDEEEDTRRDKKRKAKRSSSKRHSKIHKSEEKSREKKKNKRIEKRSKHHK
ncbi:hypothetical protein PHJA_002890200 [Phtheirospermum japonicum]|uniref:Uncharacterized protein n=1 Tax=Phtheirospermum japonicum TaxID=374723 RepID=A0A830D5U4_9LAMI|nr:hypothetical protein PHJA_002890200 [Phtheirospermum japonicum]